jgi:hypothetical protein
VCIPAGISYGIGYVGYGHELTIVKLFDLACDSLAYIDIVMCRQADWPLFKTVKHTTRKNRIVEYEAATL